MVLSAEHVTVRYESSSGVATLAVSDVTLEIRQGEFVSIIGPSGCGKSTILHCLGGLIRPSAGRVRFDDLDVVHPMPRQAAFVFQDYGLLPWKTVAENTALGLRFERVPKARRRTQAARFLDLVGLREYLDAYPGELSGGMQQRVAVARALCMEPSVLLLDEPFGAIDEQSRRYLGVEMSRVLQEAGKSVVLVTHSLEEAIYWGDRVVVMSSHPGRILDEIEVGEPRPRPLEFLTEPSFQQVRARLFELLTPPDGQGAAQAGALASVRDTPGGGERPA